MQLNPLQDYVLVEPIETESKSLGGIVIPDVAREKSQRGKVIAVGPGKQLDEDTHSMPDVKEGDEVIFRQYSGIEVTMDNKTLYIFRNEDLLATVS